MDFDFSTKAGWQKFFMGLITIGAMVATSLGLTGVDKWVTIAAVVAEFLAGVAFYISNQNAAKGKAATEIKKQEIQSNLVQNLATTAPEVAVAMITSNPTITPVKVRSIRDDITLARKATSTWEGSKAFLLQTFGDRFEYALKRMLMNNPSMKTIDAVRAAVMEIAQVQMTDKECELVSTTPGFLGALSAMIDTGIISDFFVAIDKTPELAYLKKQFMDRAEWYAVKAAVDSLANRITNGLNSDTPEGMAAAKLALQEFGFSEWQINKSMFSGGRVDKIWYSTTGEKDSYQFVDFDQWRFAGVDPFTMKDI